MNNQIVSVGPWSGIANSPFLGIGLVGLAILIVWSVIWKGLALWKAAQNKHVGWFVVFLVVNTVGILEILYIYVFSKNKNSPDNNVGGTN